MSKRQLDKDPLCKMCGDEKPPYTPATVADHIIPHHDDPELFFNGELQSLCASCHNSRKKMIERHGYSQAAGIDGMPLDKSHPWNKKGGAKRPTTSKRS